MTSIESTSTNAVANRTGLPDLAAAPAIPGLSVRPFRDRTDYARLADLEGAANLVDGIPYLPTAGALEVEMENSDGATSADDVVLVEVDGRPVASAGVRRAVRETRQYEVWGNVDPDLPAPRPRGVADDLDHRPRPGARRARGPG